MGAVLNYYFYFMPFFLISGLQRLDCDIMVLYNYKFLLQNNYIFITG